MQNILSLWSTLLFLKDLMFDTIIGILKQKVKEGVDVRFIFDDFGSFTTVPLHFAKN